MHRGPLKIDKLFNAEEYRRAGNCPWTFFAFPSRLADEFGLPPDDSAIEFLATLQAKGLRVGIWANAIGNDTSYFVCPIEDRQRLNDAIAELENNGTIEIGFCLKRTERLFSLGS